jgi:hypothetical protein
VGFCAVYKHFSGFEFFLLPGIVHARPHAGNASRWALGQCSKKRGYMKFGIRKPSLKKRIAAQTSVKRIVRHSLGLKAPKGYGWITNPKKAVYNRVYNRTTRGCGTHVLMMLSIAVVFTFVMISLTA